MRKELGCKSHVRLVPKNWVEYNPVLVMTGAVFVFGGGYALSFMGIKGPLTLNESLDFRVKWRGMSTSGSLCFKRRRSLESGHENVSLSDFVLCNRPFAWHGGSNFRASSGDFSRGCLYSVPKPN